MEEENVVLLTAVCLGIGRLANKVYKRIRGLAVSWMVITRTTRTAADPPPLDSLLDW